jgi:hypothetical protein
MLGDKVASCCVNDHYQDLNRQFVEHGAAAGNKGFALEKARQRGVADSSSGK